MRIAGTIAGALPLFVVGAAAGRIEVAETLVLSNTGSTRGTAYAMSNKIVGRDGRLHVAWLDTQSHTMIRSRDPQGRWGEPVLLGVGDDNHGGPALTMDRAGYLHVVFGPHHHPMQYRRSLRPNDSSEWTPVETFGEYLTYPSLVCGPDDTLHLTARGGPNPPRLVYHRKPKDGPWSDRMALLDPAIPPGYTQYGNSLAVDSRGRLHLAFHVYEQRERAAGKLAGYLMSPDGGLTWAKADGTPVAVPATREQVDVLLDDPQMDCRVGGLTVDDEGHPYFAVGDNAAVFGPRLYRYDGARWRFTELRPAIESVRPGATGLVGDNATVCVATDGTVYVAITTSPNKPSWGAPVDEVVLLVSTDHGATFSALEISPPDPTTPNWLPSLERNTGHNPVELPHLVYTHGVTGEGVTPTEVTEIRCVTLRRAAE